MMYNLLFTLKIQKVFLDLNSSKKYYSGIIKKNFFNKKYYCYYLLKLIY